MSDQKSKKGGKGAPKLKRSSRARTKYADQFKRTYRNKLRRVRKCNGEKAARDYALKFANVGSTRKAPSIFLPGLEEK